MTQWFSKDTSIMLIPAIYLHFVIARTPGICLQWVSRTIWPCPTCVQEDTFRMIQWHEWWQLSPQAQQCCPLAESPTQLSWPCCWTNNKQHIDGVMNQAHWYCQRCPPPQAICPQWQSLPPGSHGLQSKIMNQTRDHYCLLPGGRGFLSSVSDCHRLYLDRVEWYHSHDKGRGELQACILYNYNYNVQRQQRTTGGKREQRPATSTHRDGHKSTIRKRRVFRIFLVNINIHSRTIIL